MRYRELQNITAPAAGECGPQRRIHRGRRPGIHEGNPLLKIRFQTIGDIHDTRQVQGGLLPRQFLQKPENVGAPLPLGPIQGLRQHSTGGVDLDPLKIHEMGRCSQSLFQKWLPRRTTQKTPGLQRQGQEEQLLQHPQHLTMAGRLKLQKIRT